MSETMQDLVQITRDGEIAIVTMNYPERRNAFSMNMRLALCDAFYKLFNEDPESRVIVLNGAGGNFCAGGDLSEMTTAPASLLAMRDRISVGANLFRLLVTGPKPVIAAIEGHCIGAGMSLAGACDYAVTASDAKFSCAFVKVGLLPDTGILWTLPQRVGAAKARQLMLTGERFDGAEAGRIGFVNQVAEPGQALQAAIAVGRKFLNMSPVTLAALKGALVNGMNTVDDAWRLEIDLNPLVRQTDDHLEAVRAFMEKRKPAFTGN